MLMPKNKCKHCGRAATRTYVEYELISPDKDLVKHEYWICDACREVILWLGNEDDWYPEYWPYDEKDGDQALIKAVERYVLKIRPLPWYVPRHCRRLLRKRSPIIWLKLWLIPFTRKGISMFKRCDQCGSLTTFKRVEYDFDMSEEEFVKQEFYICKKCRKAEEWIINHVYGDYPGGFDSDYRDGVSLCKMLNWYIEDYGRWVRPSFMPGYCRRILRKKDFKTWCRLWIKLFD